MYPEDRVIVGVMPNPRALTLAQEEHWYRIPHRQMPDGIHAEYIAFYFTKRYPKDLRWAIHFYARRTGHELARRVDLLPDEPNHKNAKKLYYKIQLGPIQRKQPPIVSMNWRRITFIHTTWDRFVAAREVNDLYSTDDQFVDRVYHALKRQGIQPERDTLVRQGRSQYEVDMVIPCKNGEVRISNRDERPSDALSLGDDEDRAMAAIQAEIEKRGGLRMPDLPL